MNRVGISIGYRHKQTRCLQAGLQDGHRYARRRACPPPLRSSEPLPAAPARRVGKGFGPQEGFRSNRPRLVAVPLEEWSSRPSILCGLHRRLLPMSRFPTEAHECALAVLFRKKQPLGALRRSALLSFPHVGPLPFPNQSVLQLSFVEAEAWSLGEGAEESS